MKIQRRFTTKKGGAYRDIPFAKRTSEIRDPDGSLVFQHRDISVPEGWSQVATDVLAQKYFRKASVPLVEGLDEAEFRYERPRSKGNFIGRPMEEDGQSGDEPATLLGGERDARQVFHRMAGCWTWWGEKFGYFDSKEDARSFYDEISYMLAAQIAAPNSPQWFNTGLSWAYGITGPAQGHCFVDPRTGKLRQADDAYGHPQPHACFIQSVEDDLVNRGGIMDLWTREARLFKYGSGTGTNFSCLRGENEPLSGGGRSSGLMSFLRIGDRAAGAIKSGGTTRRAAKMVCLDIDHPDVEAFIDWKVVEEQKVAALVAGSRTIRRHLAAMLDAAWETDVEGEARLEADPGRNRKLRRAMRLARAAFVPDAMIRKAHQAIGQGARELELCEYDTNWDSEAYLTVSGQNSNNSVRVPNSFFEALEKDECWDLIGRRDGKVTRSIRAKELWERVCRAAWACADPGVQFDTTINEWHTCPEGGRINASNPCVTARTLVATSKGWQRIDSMLDSRSEVVGADGRLHATEPAFATGVKPVYRLRTKGGFELELTADHRLLTVNRGDVAAYELTKDDVLAIAGAPFGPEQLDERLAEFLGLMVGDGCLMGEQESAMVTLSPTEDALARRTHRNLSSYKQEFTADARVARDIEVHQGTLRIGTSARCIVDPLKQYAVLDERSSGKRFADAVYRLDKASLIAILRGLFTAGGTVANYGEKSQYVALDSTSLELLQQVRLLLLSFGIQSKIYRERLVAGQTMVHLPDGKGGLCEYPVKQVHSLRVSRSSRVLFEQEIGFLPESAKAEKLAELNREVGTYAD
ncbi:MAG: LAGLIDADG family homing endonuclease, partial [Planctomycetota bacterium]